jgi:hypothetical protein
VAKIRGSRDLVPATLAAKCQLKGWDVSRGVIAGIEGRHPRREDMGGFSSLPARVEVSADKLFLRAWTGTQFPAPSEKTQAEAPPALLAKIKARSEQEHS